LGDTPGALQTGDAALSRRRRIEPAYLEQLGVVDPRRLDIDQDFARTGNRVGEVPDPEVAGA
jgi:hypothetical protein